MPYAQANGINIYYEEYGTGEPLLLIMGITAPGSVWEKHLAYWKKHFRCILFDNRGVGKSDKPAGAYSSSQMAEDAAGLLQELGISEARVVGVSMGSIIAQELAIRHPQQVRSLVQMCPWARCDRKAKAIFRHIMHIKAHLRPEQFQHFIQLLIFDKTSWDDDEVYQELTDGQKEAASDPLPQPLHGLEGQAQACMNHDVLEKLADIKTPCLVTGGENDRFVPSWMVREVADAIPDCELYMYKNAGHAFHWENIEDFNPRVCNWLLDH
ncbi:alpha/beta hydrolase [Rhodohalobacter sp. SW132]|uniref:alpha/beta fold hydrolase n=1 Tax=Rhodohalobacter sp. SW132 TaxID=2293433 RepID=UPI000E280B8D|nr:alpha/beta hydrolase [Rhodohalobacter sp. SW132]REL38061.1 alpha/beta hydrolase [Rhodohalobacter sp. SW132]